ncbi:hypothetical protein F0L74_10000 [Chitinophaga agrisoli]|uniref:DUF7833 domain-containing protein n=1 Tax=Chitinophaga agrisoli TaxID=2607653 RepID=A0A5B2VUE3_9BACT|nr:hypothetical protein [Chitinophaga agrisoli]KAA2242851.1 hypothetical protein F0L74_10000 [Chitinophaga agrisoli]
MARDRMIRKKFWDDRKLAKVSRDSRLTFIGIWNLADDLGIVVADHIFLKSKVYPFDNIPVQAFDKWLGELKSHGFIKEFVYGGDIFYFLPNFKKHQTINRPNYDDLNIIKEIAEKIIDSLTDQSVNIHGSISDQSVKNHDGISDGSVPKEEIEYKKESKEEEEEEETASPSSLFGDSTVKHIDDLMPDCLKDRVYYVEHICRQLKITPESVPKYLEDFNSYLKSTAVTMKTVKDYRVHSQNWIRKKVEREGQNNKPEQQSLYKKADASRYQ